MGQLELEGSDSMETERGGVVRVKFEGRGCKFKVQYPPRMPFEQMETLAWECAQQEAGGWVEGEGAENPWVEIEIGDFLVPEARLRSRGVSRGQWYLLVRYFRAIAEASIENVWKQVFVQSQQQGRGNLVLPQMKHGNGNPR